jgi:hypothetical protein
MTRDEACQVSGVKIVNTGKCPLAIGDDILLLPGDDWDLGGNLNVNITLFPMTDEQISYRKAEREKLMKVVEPIVKKALEA